MFGWLSRLFFSDYSQPGNGGWMIELDHPDKGDKKK